MGEARESVVTLRRSDQGRWIQASPPVRRSSWSKRPRSGDRCLCELKRLALLDCSSIVILQMLSDRGRLSGTAIEFVQTFAPRLGVNFNPLVPVYFEPLLKLLGRTNKVILKRVDKCIATIISNCHLPSILYELKKGLSDEATTCRRGCAVGFERAVEDWERGEGAWHDKTLGCLEEALRRVATDKDPEVRQSGKRLWKRYQDVWPERVDEYVPGCRHKDRD